MSENNPMGCDATKHDRERDRVERVKVFAESYAEVFADENVIAEIRGGGRTHQLRQDDLVAVIQDAADSWSAASSMNGDVTKFAGDLEKANAEIERLRAALQAVRDELIDKTKPNGTAVIGGNFLSKIDAALKGGAA